MGAFANEALWAGNLDKNDRLVVAAKAQTMVVEGDDAGIPRLNHRNMDAGPQPHFSQSANQVRIACDIENRTRLARIEHVHGDDLHGATTWR